MFGKNLISRSLPLLRKLACSRFSVAPKNNLRVLRPFCAESYHVESPINDANTKNYYIVSVNEQVAEMSGKTKHALQFSVRETNFEVELFEESTLKELKTFLEERFQDCYIGFFTLEKIELATTTKWRNISSKKFYILIENTLFKVDNISDRQYSARQEMLDRTMGIGAPYYYSQVVAD